MAALGFTFFYFLFIKIYTAIFVEPGISLVGAGLSAVVISLIELVPAIFFRTALVEAQMQGQFGMKSERVSATLDVLRCDGSNNGRSGFVSQRRVFRKIL